MVLFLTNRGMQNLDSKTRGQDAPADVLSFPSGGVRRFVLPPKTATELGMIAINTDLLCGNTDLIHHLIHGTLHLLGKHHATRSSHNKIMATEEQLIRKLTGYAYSHRT